MKEHFRYTSCRQIWPIRVMHSRKGSLPYRVGDFNIQIRLAIKGIQ